MDIILFSLYESYEALCIQKGVKLSVEMEEKELPELKGRSGPADPGSEDFHGQCREVFKKRLRHRASSQSFKK